MADEDIEQSNIEMQAKSTYRLSITLVVGVLLALTGGFMDAYSYIGRGGVFANAQTGNMVLLGIHLSQGDFAQSVVYAIPIAMFIVGIALAEVFRVLERQVSWQHISLIVEIIAFGVVFNLSEEYDLWANVLISFVCGIQFETFRSIHGRYMTTTVCMGYIRTATQLLVEAIENKSLLMLKSSLLYLFITMCFIVGAIFGYLAVIEWARKAIAFCIVLLAFALLIMVMNKKAYLRLR